MIAVALWLAVPVAWSVAMVTREWVHTRQHGRRVVRHQMSIETHDARIEQALLLGERSQLEDRLHGLMSDALHQHAHHHYSGPHPSPDQYTAADTALRAIGLSLNQITAAAWHLAILDTASQLRHQATHETARGKS